MGYGRGTFSVSVGVAVAGNVGVDHWELWGLEMGGLGVPLVGVVQLVYTTHLASKIVSDATSQTAEKI